MTTSTQCPACGSDRTLEQTFGKVTEFRGFDVHVDALSGTHCDNCGYDFETHAQHDDNVDRLRAAFVEQRESAKRELERLTGREIRAIRLALGLSQLQAAELFGGSANTFSRYETEEVVQPASMDRLIRLAAHLGRGGLPTIRASRSTNTVAAQHVRITQAIIQDQAFLGATPTVRLSGVYVLDVAATVPTARDKAGNKVSAKSPLIIAGIAHGVNPVTDALFPL